MLTTSVAEGDVALVEALSRRLPELIADARELCNYVVIDTAPIGEISDALRLVRDVDNIIVVTKPGNTNRANFEMMRDLLERTAYTPAGFLVIGDSTPRTSAYYAYGATGRELFLRGPADDAGSDRPRLRAHESSNETVADSTSRAAERSRAGRREPPRRAHPPARARPTTATARAGERRAPAATARATRPARPRAQQVRGPPEGRRRRQGPSGRGAERRGRQHPRERGCGSPP